MDRRSVVKLGLAGLAMGAVRVPAAFAQAKIVFKATDVHPLGYPTVEAVERMGKKLGAATDGRISIQMYPSMQLGGEKEMIEQAQVGAPADRPHQRRADGPARAGAQRVQPAVRFPGCAHAEKSWTGRSATRCSRSSDHRPPA